MVQSEHCIYWVRHSHWILSFASFTDKQAVLIKYNLKIKTVYGRLTTVSTIFQVYHCSNFYISGEIGNYQRKLDHPILQVTN